VMEYLDGQDLGAEIKEAQGPMDVERVATYVLHACKGLADAHALGIVHRDLKPGNLFVTKGSDGEPLLKVLDFGISKTLDPMNVEEQISSLTKTEMLLGSPLYMSPEQLRSSKHVDARADIWALGAIAYEMLTGHVPFEADSLLELCWKVAQDNAKPLLEVRADVPEPLAKAVMRCLEKDVTQRWSDVGGLAVAVEPFAAERERGAAARAVNVLKSSPRRTDPNPQEILPIPPPSKEPVAASAPPSAGKNDSAAWGTTRREAIGPMAKSRRMIIAAALGAVAIIAIAIAASRGGDPAAPPAAAATAQPSASGGTAANSSANTLVPAANSLPNTLPNTLPNSSANSLANTLPNSSANSLPASASATANTSPNGLPNTLPNSSANSLPGGTAANSSANSLPGAPGTANTSPNGLPRPGSATAAPKPGARPRASASGAASVDPSGFIKVRE
ncbi:MAG TPA: protein kinase, partial [Labilithrix sp.]